MTNNKEGNTPKIVYELSGDDLQEFAVTVASQVLSGLTEQLAEMAKPQEEQPQYMSRAEACKFLSRDRSTLWRYEQAGLLHPKKIKKSTFYNRQEVLALFKQI